MTTVNSATSAAAQAAAYNQSNDLMGDTQDRFLTLLVTQLQNQDPLNPMDNAQVTSQMAQLSTVNGINQLNNTLLALSGQMDVSQSMQAAGLIGKGVLVPGNKVALGVNDGVATATPFGIDVVSPAAKVIVSILGSDGQLARKIDMGAMESGVYSVDWDGAGDGGAPLNAGAYTVEVVALDDSGQPVAAEALTHGKVSSVAYSSNGLRIDMGLAGNYSLLDIRKIM